MKRILLVLILLLIFPSFAWAQQATNWSMPGPDDKSVIYLGYIFGVVNGVLHGTGSQIMGQMFAKFNSGVLVLAGVVVFYTTILSLLMSAQDGEFLGKKFHSFFVPMRTALGIILIAPTETGYSWIQVIVMWIVLQGVGVANMVWGAALDYLNNGGVIIVQNQADDPNNSGGMPGGASSQSLIALRTGVSQLMSSVTCMELMQHAIDQVSYSHTSSVKQPTVSAIESVTSTVAGAAGLPPVPNKTAPDGTSYVQIPMPNFDPKVDPSWVSLNGICGTIQMENTDAVAINQVIMDLASASPSVTDTCAGGCYPHKQKTLVNNVTPPDPSYCDSGTYLINNGATCADIKDCTIFGMPDATHLPDTLKNLLSSASTSGTPVYSWCKNINFTAPNLTQTFNTTVMDFLGLTYRSNQKPDSAVKDLQDRIKQQGRSWFTAGTFYFELLGENMNAQLSNVHSNFSIIYPSNNPKLIPNTSGIDSSLNPEVFNLFLQPFFASDGNNNLLQSFGDKQVAPQNYGHTAASSALLNNHADLDGAPSWLRIILPGIVSMGVAFADLAQAQAHNTNPVVAMMVFGGGLVSMALFTWLITGVVAAGIALGIGAIPCVTMSNSVNVASTFVTSFLNALLIPAFIAGCMLLFYLPAVPFMIFTFGTIGWMIGVIEAMVAAPIVGFAIMSPEGNEIFGKGDPAVMLLLNVFLRPPLMIFGLIMGIMISYIGVWLINDGFGSIISMVFSATSGVELSLGLVDLTAIIILPIIYMLTALEVINRSFTLIHVLPDKVTRWLAGGYAEQLGSEMSNAERNVKSGSESGTQSLGKGYEASAQSPKNVKTKPEKQAGDDINVNPGGS